MSKFMPNFSQVPNAFIDEVMVKLPDSSVKMYLLIVRKTKGWSKEADAISITQFMKFTGKSRPTVIDAIKCLVDAEIILEHNTTRYGKVYSVNDEIYDGFFLVLPSKKILLVKKFNYSSKKTLLVEVKNFNPQKKLSKETVSKEKAVVKKSVKKPQNSSVIVYSETFEQFWNEYPKCKRKGARADAFKTFKKFEKNGDLIVKLLKSFKLDDQWTKNDGEFIPAPSSWLNKKHWENEYWIERLNPKAVSQSVEQPAPVFKGVAKKFKGMDQ